MLSAIKMLMFFFLKFNKGKKKASILTYKKRLFIMIGCDSYPRK